MYLDITGERFGRLVAIQPTDKRVCTSVVWECLCDCGVTTFVDAGNLRAGHTKSCGCLKRDYNKNVQTKNLVGMRFGKLVVIRDSERRQAKNIVWECACDCGATTFVRSERLLTGETKSCGCLRRKDLTGMRFERLVAVKPTGEKLQGSMLWECKCDCGNTTFKRAASLLAGGTRSCGCLRKRNQSPND